MTRDTGVAREVRSAPRPETTTTLRAEHDAFGFEQLRSWGLLAALVLCGALTGTSPVHAQDGRKIALIIAISDYGTPPNHPETGEPLRAYRPLNAKNDIPLVRGALEHQGFLPGDIRVLQDADADAAGIREAFRRLIRDTKDGDVVVLHYSGHGHRLTNDNPEEDNEVDGYDELLVPYGAPDEFYEGYDGSLHIRDDELGELVARLRQRAGPRGNVTVFLDACYSGTGTRGEAELPARGSADPLGPPSRVVGVAGQRGTAAAVGGTGVDQAPGPRTRGGDDELASFAVFSAASQRQVAYETWDIDGKTKVGSLSYAIARTLPDAAPGTTYRALFAAITRSLSGKVMQNPQMEGTADRQLFSNRLTQQLPYVTVDAVDEASVSLAGGSLLGLNRWNPARRARSRGEQGRPAVRHRHARGTTGLGDHFSRRGRCWGDGRGIGRRLGVRDGTHLR